MLAHRDPIDTDVPFGFKAPFVRVIDDVATPEECAALVARIEGLSPAQAPITTASGPVHRPGTRNNDRVMFDDTALARALFERLAPLVPPELVGDELRKPSQFRAAPAAAEARWHPIGLNERFRGYRYRPGQRFAPHYDGCFRRSGDEESALTLLLYLNEGCAGGETRLLDWGVTVVPRRGCVFLFEHAVLHEGAEVLGGTKYVLRSDVMYARASSS